MIYAFIYTDLFARGSNYHLCVEQYFKGYSEPELDILPENEGYWTSTKSVMKDISDVAEVEMTLIHRQLCYKGVLDCVASYR